MCKRNTRRGVSRCTNIYDVDLIVFNFWVSGRYCTRQSCTAVVNGVERMLSNQLLSNHAAVAGAMHASAIHACAGYYTQKKCERCSFTKTLLSLPPSPQDDARVSCFLFSFYLNVAGTTHINGV